VLRKTYKKEGIMLILVRIIGIFAVGMGAFASIKPEVLKNIFAFFLKGKNIYIAGVVRLSFGVIFLIAATQCRQVGIIIFLGILFLISGILIFTLGLEKCKAVLKNISEKPVNILRLLLSIPILLGVLILFAA